MSGERSAIEHPLWVDFSGRAVPPLKFFLFPGEYSPWGVVERSQGLTISHTPWYSEVALDLTGTDAVAVLYVTQKDDETSLLMACLDDAVEPFFTLITGADFGDGVTELTKLHWPEIHGMLLRSNAPVTQGRVLCNVVTPNRVQWVIADHLHGVQREEIANEQVLDLIGTSLETFRRVSRFAVELPGLVGVLGGPDRASRRLKAISKLLGSVSDIGGVFKGGVAVGELLDLAKAAEDVVKNLVALKD